MNEEHFIILQLISKQLEENPHLTFCKVLFNVGINEFEDKENPEQYNFLFRDNYNDKDIDIIDKLRNYDII